VHDPPATRWDSAIAPGTGFDPFALEGLWARLLPFAAAAALGALSPLAGAGVGVRWAGLIAGAGITAIVSVAAMLVVPWRRLPGWLALLPVLGYLATVVMLRSGRYSGANSNGQERRKAHSNQFHVVTSPSKSVRTISIIVAIRQCG